MPNPTSGHPDALGPVTAGVPRKLRIPRRSKHDGSTKPGVAETASAPDPEFSFNLKPVDIDRKSVV